MFIGYAIFLPITAAVEVVPNDQPAAEVGKRNAALTRLYVHHLRFFKDFFFDCSAVGGPELNSVSFSQRMLFSLSQNMVRKSSVNSSTTSSYLAKNAVLRSFAS
jgi:hypothetical protein